MPNLLFGKAEFEDEEFRDLVLDGQDVGYAEFRECTFVGCSLRETILRGCRLRGCTFRECDLSLAQVRDCSLRNTRFEDSKVIGINWADAAWPHGKPLFPSVDFADCAISYSTFIGLRLDGISIVGCVARDVDFTHANLTGADCRGTDFADSLFFHTNLTEADFTGATNYIISATLNTLKGTKFSFPDALDLLRALDIVLTD